MQLLHIYVQSEHEYKIFKHWIELNWMMCVRPIYWISRRGFISLCIHRLLNRHTHRHSLTQNTNRLWNWIREAKVGWSNKIFKKRTQSKFKIESMAREPHSRNCHGAAIGQLFSIPQVVQFTCSCFPPESIQSIQSIVITSIFEGGNRISVRGCVLCIRYTLHITKRMWNHPGDNNPRKIQKHWTQVSFFVVSLYRCIQFIHFPFDLCHWHSMLDWLIWEIYIFVKRKFAASFRFFLSPVIVLREEFQCNRNRYRIVHRITLFTFIFFE